MEADTIYCTDKRELDKHLSRLQYDAAYRSAHEQMNASRHASELPRVLSESELQIRELLHARKDRDAVLARRVHKHIRQEVMEKVPDVNYDGALFHAAFVKTMAAQNAHTSPSPSLVAPLQTAPTSTKQSRMSQAYTQQQLPVQLPKQLPAQISRRVAAEPKTQFLQYIATQPDVDRIIRETLSDPNLPT